RATLRSDIDQFVEEFAISVSSVIDQKINVQIHRLAGLARDSLNKNSPNSLDDARRSFDEIRGLLFGALAKLPDFWIARLGRLATNRLRYTAETEDSRQRLVSSMGALHPTLVHSRARHNERKQALRFKSATYKGVGGLRRGRVHAARLSADGARSRDRRAW